jgi:hypothetical protein
MKIGFKTPGGALVELRKDVWEGTTILAQNVAVPSDAQQALGEA